MQADSQTGCYIDQNIDQTQSISTGGGSDTVLDARGCEEPLTRMTAQHDVREQTMRHTIMCEVYLSIHTTKHTL